jgi:hypothetical protein
MALMDTLIASKIALAGARQTGSSSGSLLMKIRGNRGKWR